MALLDNNGFFLQKMLILRVSSIVMHLTDDQGPYTLLDISSKNCVVFSYFLVISKSFHRETTNTLMLTTVLAFLTQFKAVCLHWRRQVVVIYFMEKCQGRLVNFLTDWWACSPPRKLSNVIRCPPKHGFQLVWMGIGPARYRSRGDEANLYSYKEKSDQSAVV